MSLVSFQAGLKEVITNDAGIDTWANDHFSKSLSVLEGNREVQEINSRELPVVVMEAGEFASEVQVGNEEQRALGDINLSIVWQEQDPELGLQQRLELTELVVKAVMANHLLVTGDYPSGAVASAYVSSFDLANGVLHPTQIVRFAVTGDYAIQNS